jgi:polyisoprenoid-binding protein YceI
MISFRKSIGQKSLVSNLYSAFLPKVCLQGNEPAFYQLINKKPPTSDGRAVDLDPFFSDQLTMRYLSTFFCAGLLAWASGCATPPQGHEATVSDTLAQAKGEMTASMVLAPVDTVFSEVTWVGTKPTGQHHGIFKLKAGSLLLDGEQVKGGTLEVSIASLQVGNIAANTPDHAKFIRHLMSQDFFAADQFPTAKFEIVSVEPFVAASGGPANPATGDVPHPTHSVTGNLTLKEVTKTLTFPARIAVVDGRVEATAKFNIDRTDWNMNYRAEGSIEDNFIHNKVSLGFALRTLPAIAKN